MTKYYLSNNQEVTIGSRISPKSGGFIITITADNLPYLVAKKIIIEKEEVERITTTPKLEFHDVIAQIADKQKWTVPRTAGFLSKVYQIHKGAAIAIILREIALMLDHRYPDNIRTCSQVYIITNPNANIKYVSVEGVKSYETFAAFRTKADAQLALSLVKPLINSTYDREFKEGE